MTLARRIENLILPVSIREEIETGIAAGINKAVEKAVAQAVDKTASQTRTQRDQAWQEWLARQDRPQAQGIPFSEPPPSEMTAAN